LRAYEGGATIEGMRHDREYFKSWYRNKAGATPPLDIMRGLLYTSGIQAWSAAFGRSQLLVLNFHSLIQDPERHMSLVGSFVGSRLSDLPHVNRMRDARTTKAMCCEDLCLLTNFHRESNEQLIRMLGEQQRSNRSGRDAAPPEEPDFGAFPVPDCVPCGGNSCVDGEVRSPGTVPDPPVQPPVPSPPSPCQTPLPPAGPPHSPPSRSALAPLQPPSVPPPHIQTVPSPQQPAAGAELASDAIAARGDLPRVQNISVLGAVGAGLLGVLSTLLGIAAVVGIRSALHARAAGKRQARAATISGILSRDSRARTWTPLAANSCISAVEPFRPVGRASGMEEELSHVAVDRGTELHDNSVEVDV